MAKTKLSIKSPSPKWATWMFRIILYLFSFIIMGLTTLNVQRFGLTPQDVTDLVALLSFLIVGTHTFSRILGVNIKPEDYQIKP